MTAAAVERADLTRWVASVVVALGLHAAAAAWLVTRHDLVAFSEPSSAIVVDLAPITTESSDSLEEITPGPKQQENEAPPPEPQKAEKNDAEKVDVPATPVPSVAALPPPEPAERPVPPAPPVPTTTAPPPMHASQAEVDEWVGGIRSRIERHKTYPRAARMRGEKGVVKLSFSLDRQGRVISSSVLHGSGYAELDREALATIERAQPFPPMPADMPGDSFNFKVPIQFSIR